jgi:hypothetical protein
MQPVAYRVIWLSMLLVLVMACSAGTVHAQSEGKTDQPATQGGEAGGMQGQSGMEGMGQMT